MKKIIQIEGMSCSHCAAAVTKALSGVSGTSGVKVHLKKNQAVLKTDDSVTDAQLEKAVEEAGYKAVSISNG